MRDGLAAPRPYHVPGRIRFSENPACRAPSPPVRTNGAADGRPTCGDSPTGFSGSVQDGHGMNGGDGQPSNLLALIRTNIEHRGKKKVSYYGVSCWYMVGFLAGSEEACMDVADFAEWVAGTARLTPSQRREAFRSLALAEAMASLDDEASNIGAAPLRRRSRIGTPRSCRNWRAQWSPLHRRTQAVPGWVPWLKSATVGSSAWGVHTAQIGT